MSKSILTRALAAVCLGLLVACGGGGGGSSSGIGTTSGGGGGSTPLDPAVDFFLTGAAFARPLLDLNAELAAVVNPASLYETDPLTGIALPGFPKVLNEGTSLSSLATLNLAQILDPLTPQVPLVPRNSAIILQFSMPVSESSVNLMPPTASGETNRIASTSTIQMVKINGELVPARAFVEGSRVIIIGITEETLAFEASPLVFDQTGTAIEDPNGFMRVVMGGSVGSGSLTSEEGLAFKPREDKLGSVIRPLPINPGNSALDAIVLQTDTGQVTFNGFLPDVTSPRIIRPVDLSGTLASFGFVGGQAELRDATLPQLPNTSANNGEGEWANALIEITSVGGTSQYVVQSNRNQGSNAIFRLSAGQILAPEVAVDDVYTVSRTEYFEPIPPPFPSDPAQLVAITVDPVNVPRDPDDPQDQFNSDLRYFVRMLDEGGVERLDRWNPATSTFLAVPPRTSLRMQFSEGMDVTSFGSYESFYIAEGSVAPTDSAFDDMRVGRTVASENGTVVEFQPFMEDQVDPLNSRFIGFGGTVSQLRLVVRTIPAESTIEEIRETATPDVLDQLQDLDTLGVSGIIDLGGRSLGLPAALLDQGDAVNFFLSPASPSQSPFPPAIDSSMVFETLPSADPDFGVVIHRFLGQPLTANFSYPAGTVHDTVTSGVEFHDYPPIDDDGDGNPERRFIYGPQVVEVGLNIPGRLTGAPASVIQHLIDDNNPPKPSPYASPNGEDFLISLGFGATTPINSGFGARFQHIYRAGDASPSQTSFIGVALDLVGLAWSPFNDTIFPTVLDDFELLVGVSGVSKGRGPNTNQTNGIPAEENSGLDRNFDCNRLEFLGTCCGKTLTNSLKQQLAANPQPDMTTVVTKGTAYTLSPVNLFKPSNAGSTPGAFNLFLDYPTFNAGLDPYFGQNNVFSFPYDSRFPMLIEYSLGPNESPPPNNVYRFSPGILTSVLPRFRIWSQGQHPAAHNAVNWSIGIGTCPKQTGFLRAGEGGPLLKPGCYSTAVEPQGEHNGMPTQFPLDYILPPKIPSNPNCSGTIPVQTVPDHDVLNGTYDDDLCCITVMPTASKVPESNYYYANGMLMNPLPDSTSFPGPNGQPPTYFFGYGPPPGAIGPGVAPCVIPFNQGFSNNPNVVSNEPSMSAPPSRFGDNSRYYMMWKYRKRVSIIESPTIQVVGANVRYQRPIINPPVADVDPAASLAVDFRAGRQLDFAVSQLESGYIRSDEPDFSDELSGPDDQFTYVKFRASFGVAPTSTQPPVIDSIVIPYEKLSP
jgi:hypothetical protein